MDRHELRKTKCFVRFFLIHPIQLQIILYVRLLSLLLAEQCCFLVTPFSGGDLIPTHPDLPKLPIPETLDKMHRLPRNLPDVLGFYAQVGKARHPFVAGNR